MAFELKTKSGLFLIGFFLLFITGCNQAHIELESECIRLGYDNLTDLNFETRFDYVVVAQIECDNKVIYSECYNRDHGEFDKWGKYHVTSDTWECDKGRWD